MVLTGMCACFCWEPLAGGVVGQWTRCPLAGDGGFRGAGREADTVLPADLDSHQELSSAVVSGNQKKVGALSGRL